MSRVGKSPISIPSGVTIDSDKDQVTVSGPKGTLQQFRLPGINLKTEGETLTLTRVDESAQSKARHGLMRALVNNMVTGVSKGFEKKLEINGVGYRVAQVGEVLKFNLGFSHEIEFKVPPTVQVAVQQNIITVSGINKQQVGQIAAEIRALKKPEPYKGKGIKYVGEKIIRKSGKSGKE